MRKKILGTLVLTAGSVFLIICIALLSRSCSSKNAAVKKFNTHAEAITFEGVTLFQKKYSIEGTVYCSWSHTSHKRPRIAGEAECKIHQQIKVSTTIMCGTVEPFCRCVDDHCRRYGRAQLILKKKGKP